MSHLVIKIILLIIFHPPIFSGDKGEVPTSPEDIPDLISFWNFQDNGSLGDLTSRGPYQYTLEEMNGPIKREDKGIFGPSSLKIVRGQWLRILREDCPALNFYGKSEVTVIAWIKRHVDNHWQYIAGMWDERDANRQYALFANGHKQTDYTTLTRTDADNQAHGYVSEVGGATPGRPFSFSYATGKSFIEKDTWTMIAYTYDHEALRVYFNGELDENGNYNPFYWDKPIYNGGKNGSDFTVAQRAVPSWPDFPEGTPGNIVGFGGILGGLAVYDRALEEEEIKNVYQATMENRRSGSKKK